MSDQTYHAEEMSKFLQVARYAMAGILILLSTWVFFTNIFGLEDFWGEELGEIVYLLTFIGYGFAILVLMLTPAGLKGNEEGEK
tara:strand:+ start:745 stop:996 length:252 start_codon:yes stop_codon:yes gene_type:complete